MVGEEFPPMTLAEAASLLLELEATGGCVPWLRHFRVAPPDIGWSVRYIDRENRRYTCFDAESCRREIVRLRRLGQGDGAAREG